MRKRKPAGTTLGFVFVSVLLAVAALTAGSASAGKPGPTLTCTGGFQSPVNGGSYGNVVVPDGEDCALWGVTVGGSVQVGIGSALYMSGGSIAKNLSASAADEVESGELLGPTHISGNVSIDSTFFVSLDGTVDGNASFTGNHYVFLQPFPQSSGPEIGGNASFTDNQVVGLNTLDVGGNLGCSGNSTISLTSVSVGGHASGQCAP